MKLEREATLTQPESTLKCPDIRVGTLAGGQKNLDIHHVPSEKPNQSACKCHCISTTVECDRNTYFCLQSSFHHPKSGGCLAVPVSEYYWPAYTV